MKEKKMIKDKKKKKTTSRIMYLWGTVPNAFQKTSEIKWSSYWKSESFL